MPTVTVIIHAHSDEQVKNFIEESRYLTQVALDSLKGLRDTLSRMDFADETPQGDTLDISMTDFSPRLMADLKKEL